MKKLFIFFVLASTMINIGCRKKDNSVLDSTKKQADAFLSSATYKKYAQSFPLNVRNVDLNSVRLNKIDEKSSTVHLPIIRGKKIIAVIIGLPIDDKGNFELIYQDNTAAISGTGNIYQYTSLHKKLAVIIIENQRLKKFEVALSSFSPGSGLRVDDDCGFGCRLDKCYNATKAQFPGDAACSIMDIFFGVCSSATVATCLIKMATGKA